MAEPASVIADQEATIKWLHDLLLDACKVFDRYDLPEHAFHYRRELVRRAPPAPSGSKP